MCRPRGGRLGDKYRQRTSKTRNFAQRPPLPSPSLPFLRSVAHPSALPPFAGAASPPQVLLAPFAAKSRRRGGQTLLKITSFPFWHSSSGRRGRERERRTETDEQWQDLKISVRVPVFVVFLIRLDCRFTFRPVGRSTLLFLIPTARQCGGGGIISFIFGSHRSNAQRRAKK